MDLSVCQPTRGVAVLEAIRIPVVTKTQGRMKPPRDRVDRKEMGTENGTWGKSSLP